MDVQMPILNGFEATVRIREMERNGDINIDDVSERESHRLNGRIPIFVVSASLREEQRTDMKNMGLDGWVLKPINFKRLVALLSGISNLSERTKNLYRSNGDWEQGGWLVGTPNSSSSTVQSTVNAGASSGSAGSGSTDS
jgi:CheY-like chemotaxis protein